MEMLKKLILVWLVWLLVVLAWSIVKERKDAKELEERARRDMAEIEAEEREREAERRNIPEPEKPEDVTVREWSSTLYTMEGKEIHIEGIGLYCKGKFVEEYPTKTEAEAARLQFLYDNGVTDKEDYEL